MKSMKALVRLKREVPPNRLRHRNQIQLERAMKPESSTHVLACAVLMNTE
jgi:hypothetical protein